MVLSTTVVDATSTEVRNRLKNVMYLMKEFILSASLITAEGLITSTLVESASMSASDKSSLQRTPDMKARVALMMRNDALDVWGV
jgi:hypothetical protein